MSNVDDYDFKIEYLKFEEGNPFYEEIPPIPMWPIWWTTWRSISLTRRSAGPWMPTIKGTGLPLYRKAGQFRAVSEGLNS